MIIDSHAHLVPPRLMETIRSRAGEFPDVTIIDHDGRPGFSFAGSKPTRPVAPGLTDVAGRLAWMDAQGIDAQVVGGWLDMMGNQLPAGQGAAWARAINAAMAEIAVEQPRFLPLATLPMQDGGAAAEVLREAHGLGMKGAMIGTQPDASGGVLDGPGLEPFWQAADELGSVLHIHPVFDAGDDRVHDYGMANAVGRITDSLIAVARIIFSGHVARYRGARIVVGIGGAALPYVVGRLRRNHALHPELGDPDEALGLLYYDTILQDPGALRFLADTVGAERIMMGSDKPFPIGDPEPMKIVAEAGFSADEAAWINGGLAASLFGAG